MVSRRGFLTGGFATVAGPAFGQAPLTSLWPQPRPEDLARRAAPSLASKIASAQLGGRVGCAVADARTGEILELNDGLLGLPPASTAKAITCAYGMAKLGPAFQFSTRVLATGPLENGVLQGDLWLVGGGDPHFDTDHLADLARQLQAIGLREVRGRLKLALGPWPQIREIDPNQPDHVGYNPSVGALNLNFNRVYFEWQQSAAGYQISMDARSESIRPTVTRQRMRLVDRDLPIYAYQEADGRELWSVSRGALGEAGSRWLPVRDPALYVGEVFQVLCRNRGLVLRGPDLVADPGPDTDPDADQDAETHVLAEHRSIPLHDMARSMMRFSTNITAECIGLRASLAGGERPANLLQSAGLMADWMQVRSSARNLRFVDHSGLGSASRVRAVDMVQAMVAAGADGALRSVMRPFRMRDAQGNALERHPVEAVGKTGTLNFVSSLAGYIRTPRGRDLAYAIFCADLPRRSALEDPAMDRPDGGRAYSRRARRLQAHLLERWGTIYA